MNVILTISAIDDQQELLGQDGGINSRTYHSEAILSSTSFDSEELGPGALMTFSNDKKEWSDLEPYSTTKLWKLSPGAGEKTVFVQFRDAAGNWMFEPAIDQIIFGGPEDICDEPQKLLPIAATVSSQVLPFFSKEKAVDGDPSTSWSTWLSFFNKDEFITLDFGEIKRISSFSMDAASTLFGTDYFPVNFQLEISKDNLHWEEITSEQGYTPPLQSSQADSWDFKSLECRYIRVYISKSKAIFFFFKVARIAEIEVYGCDITAGQLPALAHEEPSIKEEREEAAIPERTDKVRDKDPGRKLSTPGKPVVTFDE